MRIVGGRWRGRNLATPKSAAIRPTADRLRESLFNVLGALGLEVNRLIRISFGPFQLGELAEGEVSEVRTRVLREQLGERIAEEAGADFSAPLAPQAARSADRAPKADEAEPQVRRGLIADRKGRRVAVERIARSGKDRRPEHRKPQHRRNRRNRNPR